VAVAITVAPQQGRAPDAGAYSLALAIGVLALFRRRWPLAVLLASAALLSLYNLTDYPGLFSSVPLSVALVTAWAAGRRGWGAGGGGMVRAHPAAFRGPHRRPRLLRRPDHLGRRLRPGLAGGAAAAGRGDPRPPPAPGPAGAFRGAAAERAPGPDRGPPQAGRGGHRRPLPRGHGAVRRPCGLHRQQRPQQPGTGRAGPGRPVSRL